MLFCSLEFLIFFAVVFTLYWAIPWQRPRVWVLLIASYYFYANWNRWLALIIFASTTLDFFLAHGIAALRTPRWRKCLVACSILANLGLLCYFKYVNFFLESLQSLLQSCGAEASFALLSVILPIGISFYAFEAISYIVDVYNGRIQPERNLANFLLFILFFPHLVAGPVVRARDFLPQVRRRKQFSWMRAQVGVQLFLIGIFKKWVIADRMAQFADPVFANPDAFSQGTLWIAMFAYAMQIYGDFSGYTDMALGTAHLFGYHLSPNFNLPYCSANISEFWRRWHISLSSWLRDYLFIPLGGSKGSRWQTARNLLITMTLGGLWHGASWHFIWWGVAHGVLLILHRLFREASESRPWIQTALSSVPGSCVRYAGTFLVVCLCWVLFRAQTLGGALAFYQGLGQANPGGLGTPLPAIGFTLTCLIFAVMHLPVNWERLVERLPSPVLGGAYALILSVTLVLAPASGENLFIYFQF